jgi:hypothetical protein
MFLCWSLGPWGANEGFWHIQGRVSGVPEDANTDSPRSECPLPDPQQTQD